MGTGEIWVQAAVVGLFALALMGLWWLATTRTANDERMTATLAVIRHLVMAAETMLPGATRQDKAAWVVQQLSGIVWFRAIPAPIIVALIEGAVALINSQLFDEPSEAPPGAARAMGAPPWSRQIWQ